MLAARAIDFAQERGDLDAFGDVFPDVDIDQLAIDRFNLTRQYLQTLGDLKAGDDADDRREHAGFIIFSRLSPTAINVPISEVRSITFIKNVLEMLTTIIKAMMNRIRFICAENNTTTFL